MSDSTYTYRNGRKLPLRKLPDAFVVRAKPKDLGVMGVDDAEQVSSASSRVRTRSDRLEPMMSRSRHLAPTHHAYQEAETGSDFLITDRVLVRFKRPASREDLAEFTSRYSLIQRERFTDQDFLFQLTDHTGMNPVKLVVKLTEEDATVAAADHDLNHVVRRSQFARPTDPAYVRQWHLHERFVHPEVDPRSSSRCEAAWEHLQSFGDPNVVVGVTDDGCRLDHQDFDSPGKFAAWGYLEGTRVVRSIDFDAQSTKMYQSGSNHGTACAGVIAGEADAVMTAGAAPACRLLPVKWESSGPSLFISDSKLLAVLDFVGDKVDILSNSWGGVPDSRWTGLVISRITELARTGGRRGRGILFLWAAGNEDCPIDFSSDADIPYTDGWEFDSASQTWRWVGVRTARVFRNNLVGIPGLLHIAALASTARRSHYSNYGPGILLCAPTSNSHAFFRADVEGLAITTTTGAGGGSVRDDFGGTSSATPLVAGIAALVVSANPELTALELASLLRQTASKDLDLTGYPRTPPASFDPDTSWDISPVPPHDQGDFTDVGDPDGTWSPWFGHGKVDALAAVTAAAGARPVPEPGGTANQLESHPALSIPDNDTTGVSNTIAVAATGRCTRLEVSVEITHTYIGDLRLRLISPAGTMVVLHNRNGGSSDNLRATYDLQTTPALSGFLGELIEGDWTLQVQDLAALDTGTFVGWTLALQAEADAPGGPIRREEEPGARIPDNNPTGIERVFALNESGKVGAVTVGVDITHTYRGDLLVSIVSPAGSAVTLHNRTGRSEDNLIREYSSADTPGLGQLEGEAIRGDWRLRVADRAGLDIGKLNRWSIVIERALAVAGTRAKAGRRKGTNKRKSARAGAAR